MRSSLYNPHSNTDTNGYIFEGYKKERKKKKKMTCYCDVMSHMFMFRHNRTQNYCAMTDVSLSIQQTSRDIATTVILAGEKKRDYSEYFFFITRRGI